MKKFKLINMIDSSVPIDLETLFGKDSKRFYDAVKKVKDNWLHPYEDCYHCNQLSLSEFRINHFIPNNGTNLDTQYRDFLEQWNKDHLHEEEKEKKSRKQWEEQRDMQFRILFDIARKHNLYLYWHGNSIPASGNMWDIFKDDKRIARIICY